MVICSESIKVYIRREFHQIGILFAQDALVSTLKKVAKFSIFNVEVSGISKLKGLH